MKDHEEKKGFCEECSVDKAFGRFRSGTFGGRLHVDRGYFECLCQSPIALRKQLGSSSELLAFKRWER
jgi:hypothetical protein